MQTGQNSKIIKKLHRDNSGFSLVELIVVISIMVVLVGLISLSYSVVTGANVNKVTSNISQGMARTQQLCMAKNYAYLVVEKSGSNWMMYIDTPKGHESTNEIGPTNGVDVYYIEAGGAETEVTDKLILTFTSSGAEKNRVISYDTATGALNSDSGKKVEKIIARNRNGKAREIIIYPNTGHFEYK